MKSNRNLSRARGSVDFDVFLGKRSTVARVHSYGRGMGDEASTELPISISKVEEAYLHPDDKHFDDQIGIELALGRALVALGNRYINRANNRVSMIEHNVNHSRRAQAEREERRAREAQDENGDAA